MLQQIKSFFHSLFTKNYQIKYLDNVPESVADRTVYIIGTYNPWVIIFNCPCGCREKILLNLLENASPKWCFRLERKKSISVYPSIRRTLGCRSHFWLKNGKIYFVSHSEAPSSISSKTFQKLFP